MRRAQRYCLALMTISATVALSGCACCGSVEVIEMQTDTFSVPSEEVEAVELTIELGVGELRLAGGAEELCSGELKYNVAEWKPTVDHSVRDGRASVRVAQPSLHGLSTGSGARSAWSIELSDDVPSRVVIDVGVGDARIDLSNALVERVDLDTGVGDVLLEVAEVRRDLVIRIDNGVGDVVVQVPEDIGVRVDCDRGVGGFDYTGLKKTEHGYVNAAYKPGGGGITISVDSGVGDVRILSGAMSASI